MIEFEGHFEELFDARRSNHMYCTLSCKTQASYKRNNYQYISGYYEKNELVSNSEKAILPQKAVMCIGKC